MLQMKGALLLGCMMAGGYIWCCWMLLRRTVLMLAKVLQCVDVIPAIMFVVVRQSPGGAKHGVVYQGLCVQL